MELGIGEMSQIHLIIAKTCFSYIGLYIFYWFSENGVGVKCMVSWQSLMEIFVI